jgi:hypothetical protein
MTGDWKPWETEAAMVTDFCVLATHRGWTPYAETCGWDILLVREADGFQIGIEAKLSLNAKVLVQVLEHDRWRAEEGPDCHAVLVPRPKSVNGLQTIAARLGIVVIEGGGPAKYSAWKGSTFGPELPDLRGGLYEYREDWPERCPDRRHKLPDYVPDVTGGHSAPIKLTEWKIAALKAQIIMEMRGAITRGDFKALRLSPSRWTQFWLKSNREGGWIQTSNMPDFKAQHPANYEQIKADWPKWSAGLPAVLSLGDAA